MSRRRPRGLRQEEKELWARYTTGMPKPAEQAEASPQPRPDTSKPKTAVPSFKIGEKTSPKSSAALGLSPVRAGPLPKMDSKMFGRMKRGRLEPEARLDLHGMTVADAHGALAEFIFRAQSKGLRLVLVITGKGHPKAGDPFPNERGVLRRQVPEWLRLSPLGPLVLDVAPANRKHGGEGAFYVYLKRRR